MTNFVGLKLLGASTKSSGKHKDYAFINKVDHQSYRQESIRGH